MCNMGGGCVSMLIIAEKNLFVWRLELLTCTYATSLCAQQNSQSHKVKRILHTHTNVGYQISAVIPSAA